MTGQQLKNSILQMAVQGKLVPQDPNDEPAAVLLERIRAEKEQLIKEGKIKREKNPSVIFRGADNLPYEKVGDQEPVCIADEVPFEIPENWEWVRPDDIGYFSSGKTPNPSELSKETGIPYFKVADMNVCGNELYLTQTESFFIGTGKAKLFSANTVVFPKNGGALFTNKKRILAQESLVDLNTGTYTPFSDIDVKFFYYLFSTVDFQKYYKGTALPTVNLEAVRGLLWGLPPIAEQKKIVEVIESALSYIDKYAVREQELTKLNSCFPSELKCSILQWAVQGKLVPQDPNDEPASVLLERIRAEKEQLIREGKIKRDKHESIIFRRDNSYYEKVDGVERCIDDELPFEIPDSWRWVRLSTAIVLLSGTDFKPEEYNYVSKGVPYITGASNLDEKQVLVTRWTEFPRIIANKGDVLLVCKGSGYGKTVICNIEQAHIARQIMAIKKSKNLDMKYVRIFLQANFDLLKSKGQGVIPGIDRNSVLSLFFPLPPLAEQIRISEQVEQLLCKIQEL